jgi:hypothetical protein
LGGTGVYKGSPTLVRNIRSGGNDDNFAQVLCGLRQRDSRGYPHQCVSFVVVFATLYSSSDKEEVLLFLALEDEENSRFVFLSDRCRSHIIYFPWYAKLEFCIYFRMPSECFDEILSLIKEDITKKDTNYREAISAEERLAITLR